MKEFSSWIALIILLIAAFAVRFYHLSGFGLWDSDAVLYSNEAYNWSHGHYANMWGKLGYHLLGALAVRIIGFHDYTLLYLAGFLDLATISLIYFISKKLGLSNLLSLGAAICYSFIPYILWQNQTGLPHIASSAFLSFAVLMLLSYFTNKKYPLVFLFLSGLSVVFSVTVHPSLMIMLTYFGVVLIFYNIKPELNDNRLHVVVNYRQLILSLFVFGMSSLVVLLTLSLIMSESAVQVPATFRSILGRWFSHSATASQGSQGSVITQFKFVAGMLGDLLSIPVLIMLGIAMMVFVTHILKGTDPKAKLNKAAAVVWYLDELKYPVFFWGAVIWFLSLYFIFIKGFEIRMMTPLVPLIILGTFYSISAVLKGVKFDGAYWTIIGAVFLITMINILGPHNLGDVARYNNIISVTEDTTTLEIIQKKPYFYRELADALGKKLDSGHRLLLTPRSLYSCSSSESVYFNPAVYYRLKQQWDPNLSALASASIKYVAVAKTMNDYRVTPKTTLGQEIEVTVKGLERMNAVKFYDGPNLALYEVPVSNLRNSGINGEAPFYTITDPNKLVNYDRRILQRMRWF